jgi:hypothetical protein
LSTDTKIQLVGVLLAPIIIGLFFQAFERQRERSREATELFGRYNSLDMLEARAKAWDFFSGTYARYPRPWSMFYSDRTRYVGVDREPLWAAHDDIVMVASTWALLAVLLDERRIDKRLARRLFTVQYRGWAVAFRQVRDVTAGAGEPPPEWATFLTILDKWLLAADEQPLPNALPLPSSRV